MKEHNYPLSFSEEAQFLQSLKNMRNADTAHVGTMQGIGIRTSQIMKLFVLQSGGYKNVRFTSKNLYNRMDATRRQEIINRDANVVLHFFLQNMT